MGVSLVQWLMSAMLLVALALFGLSLNLFLTTRIGPDTFATVIAEQPDLTIEDKRRLEKALGLNRSIVGQYWRFLGIIFGPSPGYTYVFTKPVRRKE